MITVLRLGHRIPRDKRITTHVALVARAFGADRMLVDSKDEALERTMGIVVKRFGGPFELETGVNWRKAMSSFKGEVVHLTMYGERLEDALPGLRRTENILVVVGAEKVPPEVYEMADLNVAVGNQPHSEVAALAVFLDRLHRGKGLGKDFGGRLEVVPCAKGKRVKSRLPDRKECLEMLKEAGCDGPTIKHSLAVNRLAMKLARMCGADLALVEASSLLHDIGRSKGHNIRHAVEGAGILRRLKLPRELVDIVERHIGAGLDSDDARELGLPVKDYIPGTLEEKLVCHADSLVSHDRKMKLGEVVRHYERKNLPKAVARLKNLHAELSALCGKDLDDVE